SPQDTRAEHTEGPDRRLSSCLLGEAAAPKVHPHDQDDEEHTDGDPAVHPVARNRVRQRASPVVGNETDSDGPGNASRSVPEQKPPPGQADDPRHPRSRHPHAAEETSQEYGIASVLLDESFRRREQAPGKPASPLVAVDQATACLAAEPVADVVPDDRAGRRNRDHADDREMALGGVDPGGDERGFSGQPQAGGLEADDPEHEEEPVVRDEVGHAPPGYRRFCPPAAYRDVPSVEPHKIVRVRIGVPRELEPGERRVALVPEAVSKLRASGFDIALERSAGVAASFPDEAYREGGAEVVEQVWDADGVV